MRTIYHAAIYILRYYLLEILLFLPKPRSKERAEIELLKIIDYMRNGDNADA